jgi:Protein of unknown function (DUF3606)
MAKSADDRGRGARLAKRDEGAYCWYVTEEQRSQPGKPGCIGRESDRLSHSRPLRATGTELALYWQMFDLRDGGSRDSEPIDLGDPQDVSFWTSELEVSKEELHAAVDAVGSGARDVRAYLSARFTRF